MATTTTNLGLTKPDYTDAADIAVINTNMDTVDTAITATKSDLGIVEDGNTATHSITAGQYVIWKGNLYTASSAIAIGTTLSTSNLTAVSNGGLNSLNDQIATVNNNTGKVTLSSEVYYQKRGNVCTVWCNNRAFSSTTSFGTLPEGCRPANTIRQPNYDSTCYLQVNDDGKVAGYLAPNQSGAKYLVTCCVSFVVA